MAPEVRARHRKLGNLLPKGTAILGAAFVALVLLSLPLFAVFANMLGERGRLRTAVVAAQLAGAQPGTLEAHIALREAAAQSAISEEALANAALGVPWQAVLERVAPPDASGVRIVGLTQQGALIQVRALADSEASLSAYEARLRGTPLFQSATLQRGLAQPGALAFTVTIQVQGYAP